MLCCTWNKSKLLLFEIANGSPIKTLVSQPGYQIWREKKGLSQDSAMRCTPVILLLFFVFPA